MAIFYLVAVMVSWDRESTPLTPISNLNLSEKSSRKERLRVLEVPQRAGLKERRSSVSQQLTALFILYIP